MKMYVTKLSYVYRKKVVYVRKAIVLAESKAQAVEKFAAGYGDAERYAIETYGATVSCFETTDDVYTY